MGLEMSIKAIAVLLFICAMVVACGEAATPIATTSPDIPAWAPTTAPTPMSESIDSTDGDARERVIKAIQRPELITKISILSRRPQATRAFDQLYVTWLDFPSRRARTEEWRAGQLENIAIIAGRARSFYQRGSNKAREEETFTLPPEMSEGLPPFLDNPVLLLDLQLLTTALFGGQLALTGTWRVGRHIGIPLGDGFPQRRRDS